MERLIEILFSPITFAIGFLCPLGTQVLLASGMMIPGWQPWALSALLILPFALMAQFRGSWVWIK